MKTLMYWGGWNGHTPKEATELFAKELQERGVDVDVCDSLQCLTDLEHLKTYDLIVPMWTMSDPKDVPENAMKNLCNVVKEGTGLAGWHGGMGDSMRHSLHYMWMTGGLFLDHPHIGDYIVRVTDHTHPATMHFPNAFKYKSEQYYVAFEPSIDILMETDYCYDGDVITMPVTWVKHWGKGKVFYTALGHVAQEFIDYPDVKEMIVEGMLWAARDKDECCCECSG